jgi:citrate lyase subunit beta/citryl-CoA lyase
MTHRIRPRRSVLYMPASNSRALEKARGLDADALIMDLEDAVAPDAKDRARDQAVAAIRAGGYGHREVVLRINGLDTPWGVSDLEAGSASGADALLVPKVDSAAQLTDLSHRLDALGAPDAMRLWVMAETPAGILNLSAILAASDRTSVVGNAY